MLIDIKQIDEGEESVVIRYREMTPDLGRIIGILNSDGGKLWGRTDNEKIQIDLDEILYLESVDDRVFAYTSDKTIRIDKTLNSFMSEVGSDIFFRCSKAMIINVNRVKSLKSLSSNRIDATMEGGEHILISRRYASEFRKLLKGGTNEKE
ncbi:MAG: LytTR family transcriptional regulator DNA-binding domain-containing protein [Lachnospiraceae bacterium]|nr:LytTR family transcriptional regulator DNA-binding domain-containing protein [Lachnospiraceae bacterium]